jgi:hypothetical protein
MLQDFLTMSGVLRIVTHTDEAYPGCTPIYQSINEQWYRSVNEIIAGFQSDSFFDGTSATGPVGPITLALHGLKGSENPYAQALDALTGSEAYVRPLSAVTLEETDETLRQQWLEAVELEYDTDIHVRGPAKIIFRGELKPAEQVLERIILTIWLRTCPLEQSV